MNKRTKKTVPRRKGVKGPKPTGERPKYATRTHHVGFGEYAENWDELGTLARDELGISRSEVVNRLVQDFMETEPGTRAAAIRRPEDG